MANIVINTNCNLRCTYCFGDDYVENEAMIISDGTFQKAKEFILSGQKKPALGLSKENLLFIRIFPSMSTICATIQEFPK